MNGKLELNFTCQMTQRWQSVTNYEMKFCVRNEMMHSLLRVNNVTLTWMWHKQWPHLGESVMLHIQAIAFDYNVRPTFQRMCWTETINKIICSFITDSNHIADILELQQLTQRPAILSQQVNHILTAFRHFIKTYHFNAGFFCPVTMFFISKYLLLWWNNNSAVSLAVTGFNRQHKLWSFQLINWPTVVLKLRVYGK